ncbi:MAG: CpaF family protein [Gemmataceae bacterium]|nr:CpaF family protein [Gemmataceae bacterium]
MRLEYVNTITGKSGARDLPPMLNPVWIGNHPGSHLVLDSPYLGPETGVFDNDVSGGDGWRFWNRNGKPIKVGDALLTDRDQFVRLTQPRVQIECWPYVVTALLTPEEWVTEADGARRLDRACADVVRQVHRELVELHPNDPADRNEWLKDGYIHDLESQILELVARRPDFPGDDLGHTELGDHLAGVAVRSALVRQLLARTETGTAALRATDSWGRMRIALPEAEADLDRLAADAARALGLDSHADISRQMTSVDDEFWAYWNTLLTRRESLPPQLCRYLALRRVKEEIKDIWFGFGPLEELLKDPCVNEIMIVDADHIFVEKSGHIENSGRRFLTDPLTVIQRIMARANRQINTAQPMADARMPDGSRVNAVIEPLALKGPCLTIRRFPTHRVTIEDLVQRLDSLTPAASEFLRVAVANRRNIIIAGGTGTGKTTMLNCLSAFIPDKERIVTIEDTAELQIQKEHVVTLQGRQSNSEGAGAVSIRDLVKNALRMRPDRIVVGECRGGEAIDMLQAMNTGHDGSMTTLHANTPAGVIRRLEVLVQQNTDSTLPVESIHAQIASAVDLVVQLGIVLGSGTKRKVVTEITEVGVTGTGRLRLVPLFRRDEGEPLRPTGCLPSFLPELIATGLVRDAVDFVRAVEET